MSPLAKFLYLIAAVAFLVAWIPIISANRRHQTSRVTYLATVILYLFAEIVLWWISYSDPRDNPVHLWSNPPGFYGGYHSWINLPTGFGVPVSVAILVWDTLVNGRPKQQALSTSALDAQIAQPLSEQAKETPRKDYW